MSKFKVLLVNPHYKAGGLDGLMISPPLGLFSLATVVNDLCQVRVLDLKAVHLNKRQIKKQIKKYNPDLIGISMIMTPSFYSGMEIASIAKKINKDLIVVAGGHHATFDIENVLMGDVDFVVRGEGEKPFRELIQKLLKKKSALKIKGLSYKKNGVIVNNPDRPFEKELNYIPSLKRDIVLNQKKSYPYHFCGLKIDSIETSRGCPFNCKFCSVQTFYKRTWRKYSENRTFQEIKGIAKRGIRNICIVDDNFTLDINRVNSFCDLLLKKKYKSLSFFCQARVDSIAKNPDMVEKMAKVGFSLVFLGIESSSSESITDMQKHITQDQVKKAIEILRRNKIAVWGAYILGNTNEKLKDIKRTVDYAISLDTDIAQFTLMTPLPGTVFYKEVEKKIFTSNWRKYDFLNSVYKHKFIRSSDLERSVVRAYKNFYFRKSKARDFLRSGENIWLRSIKHHPYSYVKLFRVLLNKKP